MHFLCYHSVHDLVNSDARSMNIYINHCFGSKISREFNNFFLSGIGLQTGAGCIKDVRLKRRVSRKYIRHIYELNIDSEETELLRL